MRIIANHILHLLSLFLFLFLFLTHCEFEIKEVGTRTKLCIGRVFVQTGVGCDPKFGFRRTRIEFCSLFDRVAIHVLSDSFFGRKRNEIISALYPM